MTQISSGTEIPIVHTVEVVDWFTGGPKPYKLKKLKYNLRLYIKKI